MNCEPERREKIIEICDKALDLNQSERAAFLDVACDGDEELREEVESLLKHEVTARGFLSRPAWERFAGRVAGQGESLEGQELGRYHIRQRLGAGGMGEVWKAWDDQLKRDVAIKILPLEFSSDPDRVCRFEQEALAVSALNHPNIITIHEVGQTGELRFIVTEFIEGRTLRTLEVCTLNWREAVQIATQIAGALSAAHTAGVIHRDIKPENVMAQDDGRVKVLDFGIAKRVGVVAGVGEDQSVAGIQTRIGARAGTLKYMSPEQARGEHLDARTDIFSLGLVLYEMIAGHHPYSGKSNEEIIEALKGEEEIPPVSREKNRIPAALNCIVTKALRQNRDERHASAEEMLVELRQLESLIGVSPDEKQRRTFKARNANQLLTQFAVFYDADEKTRMPLGGLWSVWRAADLEAGRLEREMMRKSLLGGLTKAALWVLLVAAVTMVAAAAMSVREEFEEKLLSDGHTAAVRRAAFSPNGRLLVTAGEDEDHKVIVWDFDRRERLKTFTDHTDWIAAVAFSPDGKWFATGSYDKTVIVWDAARLEKVAVLPGHNGNVCAIAFSPDGRLLVSSASQADPCKDATVLWRVGSWEKVGVMHGCAGDANNLLFSPDSRRLIFHRNNLPNTWDLATGQPLANEFDPAWEGNNAVFSPDGKRLVSVNGEGEVIFVDWRRRAILNRYRAHQDNGRAAVWSPDGSLVATGSENIILWDAIRMRKIAPLEHKSYVWGLAFSPDSRWLVSTHGDGAVLVWDMVERRRAANFNEHSDYVRAVSFARDGKRFASASADRSVIVWNAETARKETTLVTDKTVVAGAVFTPDGRELVSVDGDGNVIVWDLAQRQAHLKFADPEGNQAGECLAVSPDGRWIVVPHGVYESSTGRRAVSFHKDIDWWISGPNIYGVSFSANGRWMALAESYGKLLLLDTTTWQVTDRTDIKPAQLTSVCFSPDGQWLTTGEDQGIVRLWSVRPLRQVAEIGRHTARVKSVAFSPDGREVVSASDDKTISLWNVSRRKLITNVGTHTSPVLSVAFSPDGKQIVSGERDHSVRLYTRHRSLWGFRFD